MVNGVTEWLIAIGTMGTFVVIGASAWAALVQLRHVRAGNQLEAILALEEHFRDPGLQAALLFAQRDLAARLEDPAYRDELAGRGYIDPAAHPELLVCNWLNKIGLLLKRRVVSEELFMDLYARLIVHYWKVLEPAVALMRRRRADAEYGGFEYLTGRAEDWLRTHEGEATQ